jgi:hypothetical protein
VALYFKRLLKWSGQSPNLLIAVLMLCPALAAAAPEGYTEFRVALVIAESDQPKLQAALAARGFDVVAVKRNAPQGAAIVRAFLRSMPTNGFALTYIECKLKKDASKGATIPFPGNKTILCQIDAVGLERQVEDPHPGVYRSGHRSMASKDVHGKRRRS